MEGDHSLKCSDNAKAIFQSQAYFGTTKFMVEDAKAVRSTNHSSAKTAKIDAERNERVHEKLHLKMQTKKWQHQRHADTSAGEVVWR